MENARAILAAAGCGMQNVVKSTIYLKDMADFSEVNEVYGAYLRQTRLPVQPSRFRGFRRMRQLKWIL
jgi:enamine deaminase RidA (YjgF/YER057c/UK114 family)